MVFSIIVLGGPFNSQAATTAARFTEATLEVGHSIHNVFFYHDGVQVGSTLAVTPQDEVSTEQTWRRLISRHKLDACVCIASALRRGVLDKDEARRHEQLCASLGDEFTIAGLGELADATLHSDRLVTFGC
jgi:tRNA 2-thiouridine synthesizing protein D